MNPTKQRIKIAEACGWVFHGDKAWDKDGDNFYWKTPSGLAYQCLPDYLSDLNAMHKAEKTLRGNDVFTYIEWLCKLSEGVGWHATASQRAEAFLRTLNLWEEE